MSRFEWQPVVGSTNDVVAGWLRDGTPEVCVAAADEQLAGRGRSGRSWSAPPGAALLLSAGFRPTWLPPTQAWRLSAAVSLAMADAAEALVGLGSGAIRLKWPNDLVAEPEGRGPRKLAGVLGESEGLGSDDPRVVVGIGVNAGWPRASFPPGLAGSMTSLAELGRSEGVDRRALADAFLMRLEPLVDELRDGRFAAAAWQARQLTSGHPVHLELPDGTVELVDAVGVDPGTGALLVRDPAGPGEIRSVLVGEIRHVRVPIGDAVAARDGL
ncbi:MAG TPA: biotin--[acetyl-CoA-carboxylase] ligase [Candidatus Deferrimicrobiaceae bacterium]|nr:biotin--[acetyl-CoA-carboxylase] ligase [Candidatus Deferrimicrobiaceae bacterium]